MVSIYNLNKEDLGDLWIKGELKKIKPFINSTAKKKEKYLLKQYDKMTKNELLEKVKKLKIKGLIPMKYY